MANVNYAVAFLGSLILSLLCKTSSQQTPSPQCPCYLLPNGRCLSYDSRYLAADLEEAIVSFPDLSLLDPPNPVDNQGGNTEEEYCTTDDCRACQKDIRQRVNEVGLKTTNTTKYANETYVNEIYANCTRYGFSKHEKKEEKPKETKESSDSDEEDDLEEMYHECKQCFQMIKKTMKRGDENELGKNFVHHAKQLKEKYTFGAENGNHYEEEQTFVVSNSVKYSKHSREAHRDKRQAASSQQLLGTRFNISCTAKGIATYASGSISLCSSCWAWRQLPTGYFPQFINELICDDSDNACLSGYATCEPGLRSNDVIANISGVLTPVTLTSGAYCECRVVEGSALYGLATGNGTTGTLPPVQTARKR